MKLRINDGVEVDAVATVYTTVIYHQEFKSSMISDVFGRIELDDADLTRTVTAQFVKDRLQGAMEGGRKLPKTTAALVERAFPATVVAAIDYTKDNWDAYLRALWAMIRTADEINGVATVPGFASWVKRLGSADMGAISRFVIDAVQEGLFRAPAAGQQGEQA